MENVNEIIELVPEPILAKEKKIRKKRALERYLPDGTYNRKPLSPTYQRDYYNKTRAIVECLHCLGSFCHPLRYKEHLKVSKKCRKIREEAGLIPPLLSVEEGLADTA